MNKLLLSALLTGLASTGTHAHADAVSNDDQAKCYGISEAGKNSCANAFGKHSCSGQAKVDKDKGDFVMASPADCNKAGGTATPGKS